jgi:hypothetical protein
MRAMLLCALVSAMALGPIDAWALPRGDARATQKTVATEIEARALREMAAAIPLGSRVKAQTSEGRRVNGTLMSVTADAVIIKKQTRLPEPAVTIPFAELARLELQVNEGMSIGKALGIGLAAGAGAILTLFAFVAAIDD